MSNILLLLWRFCRHCGVIFRFDWNLSSRECRESNFPNFLLNFPPLKLFSTAKSTKKKTEKQQSLLSLIAQLRKCQTELAGNVSEMYLQHCWWRWYRLSRDDANDAVNRLLTFSWSDYEMMPMDWQIPLWITSKRRRRKESKSHKYLRSLSDEHAKAFNVSLGAETLTKLLHQSSVNSIARNRFALYRIWRTNITLIPQGVSCASSQFKL